jgi:hypothetical protein
MAKEFKGDFAALELGGSNFERMLAFLRVLEEAGPKAVADSLNRSARIWRDEIRRHAPVGETGFYRNSITVIPAVITGTEVVARVGSNIEYAIYLEYGSHKLRGYMQQVAKWKPGDMPVTRWYAKDGGLAALLRDRDKAEDKSKDLVLQALSEDNTPEEAEKLTAKAEKMLERYQRKKTQVSSGFAPSTEEFGPPFRASWDLISGDVVAMLRNDVAEFMQRGVIKA